MIEVETNVRNWGNSLGITLPHETVKDLGIQSGEKIKIWIGKESNILRETFGKFKTEKSTEQIMKEIDEELYND